MRDEGQGSRMKDRWPLAKPATDEERSLRLLKDALMEHAATAVVLSAEDEERAAEHGLRHDLLLKLYDELEPAFDVSPSWPPRGYDVNEDGELLETNPHGMAAIGFDCGYDSLVFHKSHADDKEYVAGFVEGCLERLLGQDEPEESDHLRDLWENGDEEDRGYALRQLKEECEVQEGRHNDRRAFPV